jgi:hypothetical protein
MVDPGFEDLSLQELRDLFEENEAVLLKRKMQAVHIAFTIFTGNDRELRNSIDGWRDYDLSEAWVGSMEPLNQFLIESVFRALHNYLASAKTLVDITRRVVPRIYEGSEFATEYSERITVDFAANPLSQFVQGLRNFVLHEGSPRVLASMTEGRAVTLDLTELRKWDGWNETARNFIANLLDKGEFPPVRVPLMDIIDEYTGLVRQFNDWLLGRQRELHRDAFEEGERISKAIRRHSGG